jgi:hypothetical protein
MLAAFKYILTGGWSGAAAGFSVISFNNLKQYTRAYVKVEDSYPRGPRVGISGGIGR